MVAIPIGSDLKRCVEQQQLKPRFRDVRKDRPLPRRPNDAFDLPIADVHPLGAAEERPQIDRVFGQIKNRSCTAARGSASGDEPSQTDRRRTDTTMPR